jgi:hypothetical protein
LAEAEAAGAIWARFSAADLAAVPLAAGTAAFSVVAAILAEEARLATGRGKRFRVKVEVKDEKAKSSYFFQ